MKRDAIRVVLLGIIALVLVLGCDAGGHGIVLASAEPGVSALVSRNILATDESSQGIRIGMSREAVVGQFNTGLVTEISSSIVEVAEHGPDFPGKWTFNFNEDKLTWFVFNASSNEISNDKFQQYLVMTQGLIDKYAQALGTPGRVTRGIQEFRDPASQKHQGYQVLHASWDHSGGRVVVNYSFIGEGNNYSFLVSLQGS